MASCIKFDIKLNIYHTKDLVFHYAVVLPKTKEIMDKDVRACIFVCVCVCVCVPCMRAFSTRTHCVYTREGGREGGRVREEGREGG